MHSIKTTKMRLPEPALVLPEPVFWSLPFRGQRQYHLEQVLEQWLVREESLRPGNLCTGKARKNDA